MSLIIMYEAELVSWCHNNISAFFWHSWHPIYGKGGLKHSQNESYMFNIRKFKYIHDSSLHIIYNAVMQKMGGVINPPSEQWLSG